MEVFHIYSAVVVLTGVSKTEATKLARAMNKGSSKERIFVRPVRKAA